MTLVGKTLKGRYEIDRSIGSGGMSDVYHARDLEIGREVAIKTVREGDDADRAERLVLEGRMLAGLSEPGIVTLFDTGTIEDLGRPFLVLEYLEGETLEERVKRQRLPPAEACAIMMQVTRALVAAHRQGVRHRDLKPGNVMLLPDGQVKVFDLGLAKLDPAIIGETIAGLTIGRQIIGTPGFMAPERILGESGDDRSDLFAIGAMLYVAITGQDPFPGEDVKEKLERTLAQDPEPLARFVGDIPNGLARVVSSCLSRKPEGRPEGAEELVGLLAPYCAANHPASLRDSSISDRPTLAMPPSSRDPTANDWREMEDLFARIPGELSPLWRRYRSNGAIVWTKTPDPERGGKRVLARFLDEARTAGQILQRMRIDLAPTIDLADLWLNAVLAVVDPMSQLTLSGQDSMGESEGGEIKDVVHASVQACAHFASALRLNRPPMPMPFVGTSSTVSLPPSGPAVTVRAPGLYILFDPLDPKCNGGSNNGKLSARVDKVGPGRAKEVSVVLQSLNVDGHHRPRPHGRRFPVLDSLKDADVCDVAPGVPQYFQLLHQVDHATYFEQGHAAWQLHIPGERETLHGVSLDLDLRLQTDLPTGGVRLRFQKTKVGRPRLEFVESAVLGS